MKLSNLLALLAAVVTSVSALAIGQSPLGAPETPIPGDSPVVLCSETPALDTVTINKIDIDPNPPAPGKNLSIVASGVVHQRIENGATIHVEVKLGYIILLKKAFDFCEEIKNVDMECPIEEGPLNVTKEVELPSQIPPGKFVVTAHVADKMGLPITCLKATVNFAHKG